MPLNAKTRIPLLEGSRGSLVTKYHPEILIGQADHSWSAGEAELW